MSGKVNVGIWDKLTKVVYLLFFMTIVIGIVLWYMPLIQQNQAMRNDIRELEQRIKGENDSIRELQLAIDAIKNDPDTVERLARERLGYAKPGETVIRFKAEAPFRRTRRVSAD
jgi:cell division protein FtsB